MIKFISLFLLYYICMNVFICPICNKKYISIRSLRGHISRKALPDPHFFFLIKTHNEIKEFFLKVQFSAERVGTILKVPMTGVGVLNVWKKYFKESEISERNKKCHLLANNKNPPWNKGLGLEDIRVKKSIDKRKKTYIPNKESISKTLKLRYKKGEILHWTKSKSKEEIIAIKRKIGEKNKVNAKERFKDSLFVQNFLSLQKRRPTGIEKNIINLNIERVKYTGDRQFWKRFKNGTHKNPDFIITPFRRTHKVVEVFGGKNYFHFEKEVCELIAGYKEIGVNCLIIWEEEIIKDINSVKEKILNFIHSVV